MSRLLLKKGRDYRGHGVFVKKGEPFEVDDDKRDELLATGYFSLISVSMKFENLFPGSLILYK